MRFVNQIQHRSFLTDEFGEVSVLLADGGSGCRMTNEGSQYRGSHRHSSNSEPGEAEHLSAVLEAGGQHIGVERVGAKISWI